MLCEKPFADTVEEAEAMTEAAEAAARRGQMAMADFNYRRMPATSPARRMVAEGRLGALRHARVIYLVTAIAEGSAPVPSFADGPQVQRVLAAVEESAAKTPESRRPALTSPSSSPHRPSAKSQLWRQPTRASDSPWSSRRASPSTTGRLHRGREDEEHSDQRRRLPGPDHSRAVQRGRHPRRHHQVRPHRPVSKSGTLTHQLMYELRDIGFSTCVGIGGGPVVGMTRIDCLTACEADPETELVVLIGEIGGDAEERAAAYIREHVTKPVVGYIVGTAQAEEGGTGGGRGPRGWYAD